MAEKQKDNRATEDIVSCQKGTPDFLKYLCDIMSNVSYIRTFLPFYLKLWLSSSLFPETQKKHVRNTLHQVILVTRI